MLLWCRSLEAELTSKAEDIAAYVENLSVKNEIVQSLTVQLASLQDSSGQLQVNNGQVNGSSGQLQVGSGQLSCSRYSDSADSVVETTRRLELLTVLH